MNIEQLIEYLKEKDPDMVVPMGFDCPHSYRGDYDCLGLEPRKNVTVGDMLASARDALGTTYHGWKGGDYRMNRATEVYLAVEGSSGEKIGRVLLDYMTGEYEDERMGRCNIKVTDIEGANAEYRSEIEALNKDLWGTKKLNDDSVKEIDRLDKKIASHWAELEKSHQIIENLKDKVKSLETELTIRNVPLMKESLKSSARLAINQADEIEALKAELTASRGLVASYHKGNDRLKENIEAIKNELTVRKADSDTLMKVVNVVRDWEKDMDEYRVHRGAIHAISKSVKDYLDVPDAPLQFETEMVIRIANLENKEKWTKDEYSAGNRMGFKQALEIYRKILEDGSP